MDLSRGPEWATWFVGSKLSIAWNCVHRWAERDPSRVAAVGLGEDGARWEYTFAELSSQVTRLAEGLVALGVEPGDRVAIYMPMCPEVAVASHACAHVGAVQVPDLLGLRGARGARAAAGLGGEGRHHRRLVAAARQAARHAGHGGRGRARRRRPSSTSSPGTATTGRGEASSSARASSPRSRSTPSTRTSSPIPRARPGSRRACCTSRAASSSPSAASSPTRPTHTRTTSSTSPQTWAGSWARGPSSAAARWAAKLVFAEGAPD